MDRKILAVTAAPSGKPVVTLPVQSPELCDLQDEYGYRGYRSDYRDVVTGTAGLDGAIFDPADDVGRLEDFVQQATQLVADAQAYLQDEADRVEREDAEEEARRERDWQALQRRIERDAPRAESERARFTGGERIVFSVPLDYDGDTPGLWPGRIGTCVSREDVSPDALRRDDDQTQYHLADHTEPVAGNSSPAITRYFGWRGTTCDVSIGAHGVRMVERIVRFRNHARIYLSRFDTDYTDD